ncbi:MAG: aspartate kinase [Candidatus Bathyarchaeia archaeon]|nr:aspartate kinase [Candidatus Bathyarchaeota archaeon]
MLIVMKFGGALVSKPEKIKRIIEIIKDYLNKGIKIIVVGSAVSKVTDELIKASKEASLSNWENLKKIISEMENIHFSLAEKTIKNREILKDLTLELKKLIEELKETLFSVARLKELTPRSKDFILSFGEKFSCAILCAAAKEEGLKAKWITGGEAGLITNDEFGKAKPLFNLSAQKLNYNLTRLLNENIVPIVTGFNGCTPDGVVTTLGRGGSDYTATIIGAALKADEVLLWKEVDGLMTADPKIEPKARTIRVISYAEASEVAYFGAKIIHPRALKPVIEAEIPVRIRNAFNLNDPGTLIIKEQKIKPKEVVKAISFIKEVGLINVSGSEMVGTPGVAAQVFKILGDNGINILMISQGSSEVNISFAVPRESLSKAVNLLELNLLGGETVKEVSSEADVCIVAVIGAGMKGTPGVAARVFKAVADKGINVRMIAQGSSELNISFVVKEEDGPKAVNALHEEFKLYED